MAVQFPDLQFMVAEYSREKRAENEIIYNLPKEKGLGTFIWEPTDFGEKIFDQGKTNAYMDLYSQMAKDFNVQTVPMGLISPRNPSLRILPGEMHFCDLLGRIHEGATHATLGIFPPSQALPSESHDR